MPDPVRRLSVPPLAGLEGQGHGSVGGGVAAGGVPHPFPLPSSTICGAHPYAFVQPLVHQRGCARGSHPGFNYQGCGGDCSSSLSRFLQSSVRGLENLGVVASGHRSLDSQQLHGCVTLPDGDHSVCPPFHPSGGLDGLHRSSGGVPSDSGSSGISSLPPLCVQWPRLSVQSVVFRPIHGPAGFHSGHGSYFCHPPLAGYSHASLPRRLTRPVLLSGVSPPGSPGGPGSLSGAGYCGQPREIQPRSLSGCPIPRGDHQYPVFCGFSVARSRLQASVNRRRISILCLASRQCLALSAGDAFLHGSPRPRGQAVHAVSPTLSSSVLGSSGPIDTCDLVTGMPSGSAVVASPASPVSGSVSLSGVSRPRLLVRRLGRRVGGASGPSSHFRPLGRVGISSPCQRQGAACRPSGSPPLPVVSFGQDSGRLLRQRHCSGLSSQSRGHQVSHSQLHRSGDRALVGVARHPSGSAVHPGLPQRPSGLSVSSSSAPAYRVVSQHDCFSIFESSVASSGGFVCHLSKSPLFDLFFSVPRPSVSGHGRLSPILGRSSGVCISSVFHHSPGSSQAPGVSGDGAHTSGSILASAALVSGPPPAVSGPPYGPPQPSRPPAPASVSSMLPGSPQAASSCLETLRRFTRAAGFSSAVASQASLARRPSSRANYQLKWSVYRSWCRTHGHSISRPTLSKVAEFLCWLRSSRGLGVSSIKGYRSMLSAVFRFHLPTLSSHPVLRDLLQSFRLSSAERQLRPPAWDLSMVLRFLNSSAFEPLSEASLRALSQKTLFLLALATSKRVGELQALCSIVTYVGSDACLSYVPQFVAKSESLTRSIPRSFLVKSLSDFAAGLDEDLLLCPVRALRIYLARTRPLIPVRHRLFVSPRRPSHAMSKNAVSFFLREVIHAAEASRPEVGSVRAHEIRCVSTSVAFHRNWSVSVVLEFATWSSSSVFSSLYLRDIQHEYDGIRSLGPFVAAGSRIE